MIVKTPKQREALDLIANNRHTLLYGGSRSGKTFAIVYAILVRALKEDGSRHVFIRATFTALKRTIIDDTFQAVVKTAFPELITKISWNRTSWVCTLPNGSELWWLGLDGDRVDKILGAEYSTIFFNEISEITWKAVNIAATRLSQKNGLEKRMISDCNPPSKSHWSYQLYVKRQMPVTRKPVPENDYAIMRLNPIDNTENLDPHYLEILENLHPNQRARFLDGLFLDDAADTLWAMSWIENNRSYDEKGNTHIPELYYVAVAIDPAVSVNKHSDETGIVVVGATEEGHYYVLEDLTGKYTPNEWARKAINTYERWNADFIIAEKNNGGDMVENTILTMDSGINVQSVVATKGKAVRAEPMAALYERNLVHHCGEFKDLEEQMTEWVPLESPSPDRVDALVWGLTALVERVRPSYTPGWSGHPRPGDDQEQAEQDDEDAEDAGNPDSIDELSLSEIMENEELWTA